MRAGGWDGVGAIALSAHAEVSGQSLNLKTSCLLAKANLTFRWVFFFFFFFATLCSLWDFSSLTKGLNPCPLH